MEGTEGCLGRLGVSGRVWDDTGRFFRELERTGRDARVVGGTGRHWVKGRLCKALQGTGSTGEGTGTSKKELGIEMRTGRN